MSPSSAPKDPNDRRALLSAYKEVLESEKNRGKSEGGASPGLSLKVLVLLGLTMVMLVGLVEHDRWLDPVKMPEESRPLREASLRLVMSHEIHGIEAWRQAHGGALPDSAAAARTTLSPFKYEVANGQYQLTGSSGGITVTYQSTESLSAFLGQSYEIVRNRGKQ